MVERRQLVLVLTVGAVLLVSECTRTPESSYRRLPLGGRGVDVIDVQHPVAGVALGLGSAWVMESSTGERYYLDRIDPESLAVLPHPFRIPGPLVSDFAVGAGVVWLSMPTLSNGDWGVRAGFVRRLDPETGRVVAEIGVGKHPAGIAVGAGAVWVANEEEDTLSRIDPSTNRVVATIPVGHGPDEVTFAFGSLWVANTFVHDSVMRIDPSTNRVVDTIDDVGRPVPGDGVLWLIGPSPSANEAIIRIDPSTGETVGDPFPLDIAPGYVTAGHGAVWLGKWYEEPSRPPCPEGGDCPFAGTFEYYRYDVRTGRLVGNRIVVNGPTSGVVGLGGVWFPANGLKQVLHLPFRN